MLGVFYTLSYRGVYHALPTPLPASPASPASTDPRAHAISVHVVNPVRSTCSSTPSSTSTLTFPMPYPPTTTLSSRILLHHTATSRLLQQQLL